MPEKLVLAQLVIDESGVVTGLANIGTALKNTGNESDRVSQKVSHTGGIFAQLEHRMFSLRHIAGVVLGGFTVAGALHELKALIGAVFESDLHFAALKASAGGFHETLVKMLGSIFGTSSVVLLLTDSLQHLTALFDFMSKLELPPIIKGLLVGFVPLIGIFKAAGIVLESFNTIVETLLPGESAAARGAADLREAFTFSGLTLPKDAAKNIYEAGRAITILREQYQAGALTAAQFSTATENVIGILLKQGSVTAALQIATNALMMGQAAGGAQAEGAIFRLIDVYEKLRAKMIAAGASAQQVFQFDAAANSILRVKTELEGLGISQAGYNDALRTTDQHLVGQKIAYTAIGVGLKTVGAGLANLIIQGGKGKDMFAGILKSIAQSMFVMAAEYVAYGIAASTVIGAATLGGTPAQFFKAAALFAGVGTLAALGAKAVGGAGQQAAGGAGGGGGGGELGLAPTAPARAVPNNLTIIIQGNVIGQEQYVRQLVVDVQQALSRGAGGGSL